MEYAIVVLLLIIIYYLYKANQQSQEQADGSSHRSYRRSSSKTAFIEEEWDEAVNDFIYWQIKYNDIFFAAAEMYGGPVPGWEPPDYNEIRNDRSKLDNLKYIVRKFKEDIENRRLSKK